MAGRLRFLGPVTWDLLPCDSYRVGEGGNQAGTRPMQERSASFAEPEAKLRFLVTLTGADKKRANIEFPGAPVERYLGATGVNDHRSASATARGTRSRREPARALAPSWSLAAHVVSGYRQLRRLPFLKAWVRSDRETRRTGLDSSNASTWSSSSTTTEGRFNCRRWKSMTFSSASLHHLRRAKPRSPLAPRKRSRRARRC